MEEERTVVFLGVGAVAPPTHLDPHLCKYVEEKVEVVHLGRGR